MNAPIKGTPPWFLESSLSFCLVQGLVPTEIKKFQTADHNAFQIKCLGAFPWCDQDKNDYDIQHSFSGKPF